MFEVVQAARVYQLLAFAPNILSFLERQTSGGLKPAVFLASSLHRPADYARTSLCQHWI
jgi:hypothetical protein